VKVLLATAILILSGCSSKRTDNIDLPFADDPQVIGKWESVDFVKTPDQFTPGKKQWEGDLTFRELVFQQNGKTSNEWFTWTKGVLLHHNNKTASQYTIKPEGGATYMFLEWKSGDYTFRGLKPWYYVLKKS
jgi:bla regulator protein BlaR1